MLNVVTNICPGPVTLLISVPLYVLITLNFDVFKLINLLATNEGQLLFFFFCLTFITRKRSRLQAAVTRRFFCLLGKTT